MSKSDIFFLKSGKIILLIKKNYIVLITSWKWKGKALDCLAESKWIERKVKGRSKKETSRAMICLTKEDIYENEWVRLNEDRDGGIKINIRLDKIFWVSIWFL